MKPVFVIIFTLTAQFAQAGGGFVNTHIGTWYGVGLQSDGSNWDMLVTLGRSRGRVSYNSLNCGGWWAYQSEQANALTAVESIRYGLESCVETGDIKLLPYGQDSLLYLWCGPEDGASALAILNRAPPSQLDYRTALLATKTALDTLKLDFDSLSCNQTSRLGV
jgi:hypothetical protein